MRGNLVRPTSVIASALLSASSLLAAGAPDPIPVANWAAPPYWTPTVAEAKTSEQKHPLELAVVNPSLAFHAVTPCRIADTRGFGFTGPYGPPSLIAGNANVRTFLVTSPNTSCGIPSGVAAVSFNFAATTLAANGNLVVYPSGASVPNVSSLNWTPSEGAISNAAVVPLGAGGGINVIVNGPAGSTVDLIVDVNGYYAADPVVTSLNGNSGALNLVASGDVTVTPGNPNTTIGTNATSANTPNTIVRRDGSGSISTGLISASDLDLGGSGRLLQAGQLFLHGPGTGNTFGGLDAGNASLTGHSNTGFGSGALQGVAGGIENVGFGFHAGIGITSGNENVAIGFGAMGGSTGGDQNVGIGPFSCSCLGNFNIGLGYGSLSSVTGSNNIAIGANAGNQLHTGSANIYIANAGANESSTIRIGASNTATYISGISSATSASGVAVLVNSSGKLGTTTSSVRFKEDVRDLGGESEGLLRLRPVAFRYKPELDPEGIEQFGLIAEEVEKVYPGLVTCGEDGEPQAVRYHFLVPMLVNEVQKDRTEIRDLKARLERLEALIAARDR